MRISTMSFVLFFVMNAAAFAQTSGPHDDTNSMNNGTTQNNPIDTGRSRNLSHGGLITPHTTNDRGVIPANPSTDNDMRNPGRSQGLITHAEPQSQ